MPNKKLSLRFPKPPAWDTRRDPPPDDSPTDALLEYNSMIGQALQLQAQKADLDTKKNAIRNQAMEVVYMADRALAYWSAGMISLEGDFASFQSKALWADGPSPSQFTTAELQEAVTNMVGAVSSQQEIFGVKAEKIPSVENSKSEIIVSITEPVLLAAFRSQRKLAFTTVISGPTAQDEFAVPHTSDKYDVRVWYVRPRLRGAVAESTVDFDILHLGQDQLQQKNGSIMNFVHDPVPGQFTYRPNSDPAAKDWGMGVDGVFYNSESDGYAPLGLFARWEIKLAPKSNEGLDPKSNQGLDLTELSEIEIEFGCYAHAKVEAIATNAV